MKRIAAPCLLALLCIPQLAHAQVYRCKQANGATAFQDQPCPAGAAGAKTSVSPVQGYAPGSSDRPAQAAPASTAADANAANRAQVEAANRSNRCSSARQQLGVMQEQRAVYHYDNDGNKVYVADEDRPAAIASARETIAADCQ
jgi:hypothetical protein